MKIKQINMLYWHAIRVKSVKQKSNKNVKYNDHRKQKQ